ncbi:V-type ATP synthase subunit I [Candidatus Margulisiibacteriota bacterium]
MGAELEKVRIVAIHDTLDAVIRRIAFMNDFELITDESTSTSGDSYCETMISETRDLLKKIEPIQSYIDEHAKDPRGFIEGFLDPRKSISYDVLKQRAQLFPIHEVLETFTETHQLVTSLEHSHTTLQEQIVTLEKWKHFPIQHYDDVFDFEHFRLLVVSVPQKISHEFQKELLKEQYLLFDDFHHDKHSVYFCILLEKQSTFLERISHAIPFTYRDIPHWEGDVSVYLSTLYQRLMSLTKKLGYHCKKLRSYTTHKKEVQSLHDYLKIQETELIVSQYAQKTEYTTALSGWIPRHRYAQLQTLLKKVAKEIILEKVRVAKEEKLPVYIENKPQWRPFEIITYIYGAPNPKEFDPTLFLAPFFIVFFGMCLSDAGYGLSLIVLSWYLIKRYDLPPGGLKLMRLFIYGGVATIIVGIITGGYFALDQSILPSFLLRLKILDPINDPITMLIISLILGITQILFGTIISFFENIHKKRYADAYLDSMVWFLFLSSIVVYIVGSFLHVVWIVAVFSKVILVGALVLILTQGRHKKNVIMKFFSGLISLYKLSGYLGDVLSYSRLLALGMTSAVVGMIVNLIAGMVKGFPIVGVVLTAVIFVFGHLLNLIVSVMGAFIHTTRLQLVEFFGKFFEGGGKFFKPFQFSLKYHKIE